VDYDYEKGVRLLLGKPSASSHRSTALVNHRGRKLAEFSIRASGEQLVVHNSQGLCDFELQLPWATSVSRVEGGKVVGPESSTQRAPVTSQGVVVKAQGQSVSLVWR